MCCVDTLLIKNVVHYLKTKIFLQFTPYFWRPKYLLRFDIKVGWSDVRIISKFTRKYQKCHCQVKRRPDFLRKIYVYKMYCLLFYLDTSKGVLLQIWLQNFVVKLKNYGLSKSDSVFCTQWIIDIHFGKTRGNL